jgi:hypothetical protein
MLRRKKLVVDGSCVWPKIFIMRRTRPHTFHEQIHAEHDVHFYHSGRGLIYEIKIGAPFT